MEDRQDSYEDIINREHPTSAVHPRMPLQDAVEEGLCCMLDLDMDDAYLEFVESMAMRPDEELDLAVPIVYTPLNGAGFIPVSRVMRNRGFSAFRVVKEQSEPDPEFTTVGYPNPEDPPVPQRQPDRRHADRLYGGEHEEGRRAGRKAGDDQVHRHRRYGSGYLQRLRD